MPENTLSLFCFSRTTGVGWFLWEMPGWHFPFTLSRWVDLKGWVCCWDCLAHLNFGRCFSWEVRWCCNFLLHRYSWCWFLLDDDSWLWFWETVWEGNRCWEDTCIWNSFPRLIVIFCLWKLLFSPGFQNRRFSL